MKFLVALLFISVQILDCSARLCQVEQQLPSPGKNGGNSTASMLYECPDKTRGDPDHLTECCESQGMCCEKRHHTHHGILFSGLDSEILVFISIGVIAISLFTAMLLLVCCFWSKCPCYSSKCCHSRYRHNDTIAFSTREEMMKLNLNGMPDEDYSIKKSYDPNAVKVRPVYDA